MLDYILNYLKNDKGFLYMTNISMKVFSVTLFLLISLFIFLSRRIIFLRREKRISIGHDNTIKFENAIRAHANFSKYTPLALLEIFILTQMGVNSGYITVLCVMILFGRVSHAMGLSYFELKNEPNYRPRVIGMMLTFLPMILSAVLIMVNQFANTF